MEASARAAGSTAGGREGAERETSEVARDAGGLEIEGKRSPTISRAIDRETSALEIRGKSSPTISKAIDRDLSPFEIDGDGPPSILKLCRSRWKALKIDGDGSPRISGAVTRGLMPKESKLDKRARATKVLDGLAKRFAPDETVMLSGKSYSGAELTAIIRRQIAALDAVDRASSALRQAVRDEGTISKGVNALIQRLKVWILGVHGPRHDVLGDFGWAAPKGPGPKTARAKAEQVRKAAERRAAKKKALAGVRRR